jgi:hypothetical protein
VQDRPAAFKNLLSTSDNYFSALSSISTGRSPKLETPRSLGSPRDRISSPLHWFMPTFPVHARAGSRSSSSSSCTIYASPPLASSGMQPRVADQPPRTSSETSLESRSMESVQSSYVSAAKATPNDIHESDSRNLCGRRNSPQLWSDGAGKAINFGSEWSLIL